MIRRRLFSLIGLSLIALTSVGAEAASYSLAADDAVVNFISTKAGQVAEVHRFDQVRGSLDESGALLIEIDLTSVDTAIEIRNQRMREMLFEVKEFPKAVLTAQVPTETWRDLAPGETATLKVAATLSLHGESQGRTLVVDVTAAADGGLRVTSRMPVVINANDFALAKGIERLRAVAGLPSISLAVPVTFTLHFRSA